MSEKRVLKVCETGDFYRHHTKPQLRLEGNWLAACGIAPNIHVTIESPKPGVLIISAITEERICK